jgi:hypothetical protein
MARNTPCKASFALRDVLKTSSRKASQVVHFKGAKKIFAARVDNFVRKYMNPTGIFLSRPADTPG